MTFISGNGTCSACSARTWASQALSYAVRSSPSIGAPHTKHGFEITRGLYACASVGIGVASYGRGGDHRASDWIDDEPALRNGDLLVHRPRGIDSALGSTP